MNVEYEWILFDWNGTLLDDLDYGITVLNKVCKHFNVPEVNKELYLRHFGFPLLEFYEKIGFDFNSYSFDETAEVFMKHYHENLDSVLLHSGVHETLTKLNKYYKLGIISAYKQSRLLEAVKKYGVEDYFQCVYGIADDRAASKSHSLKTLLVDYSIIPEKTLLVGDTLHDYEVASENGIACVLIEAGHQSQHQWENIEARCVDSLNDLMALLNLHE